MGSLSLEPDSERPTHENRLHERVVSILRAVAGGNEDYRRSRPSTFIPGAGENGDCEGLAMSRREALGVVPSAESPYTHNSHNMQKYTETGNCADIADSAHRDSGEGSSKSLESPADACGGLAITFAGVLERPATGEHRGPAR